MTSRGHEPMRIKATSSASPGEHEHATEPTAAVIAYRSTVPARPRHIRRARGPGEALDRYDRGHREIAAVNENVAALRAHLDEIERMIGRH